MKRVPTLFGPFLLMLSLLFPSPAACQTASNIKYQETNGEEKIP